MQHLQPKMVQILVRYRIPATDAERMLEELFLTLQLKREAIAYPDRWLLASLKNRCLIYWRARREQLCRVLDRELLRMLASPEVPDHEKRGMRLRLEVLTARLSAQCRSRLEVRYGLGETQAAAPEDARPRVDDSLLRCLAALTRRMVRDGMPVELQDA